MTPSTPEGGALEGCRVLDLADETGAYCGKLLADMGADVIKVEPPGGDPTRAFPPFRGDESHPDASLFFLYMNTSKRGVTLDVTCPEGRDRFRRLACTADLVIETFPPGRLDALGLGWPALHDANPALVLTSITGFGQTGPHRDFRSTDLIASALGGAMQVTGEASDPPVALAGGQAHVAASLFAAVSSLIALHHRAATGVGQHVDVSVEEAVASITHICGVGKWLDDGIVPQRGGTGLFASVPSGAYPCRDGLVYLMVNRPLHWQALALWINEVTGNDAVLDPLFEGPSSNRYAAREMIDHCVRALTSRFTVEEVYREGQRRHLAVTPMSRPAAVVADPQLVARRYFVEAEGLRYPGAPFRLSETPWAIRRRAPRLGEHDAEGWGGEPAPEHEPSPRPPTAPDGGPALSGVRVLEFTSAMAGPWVGRIMAYAGAEVIRVESRARPDVVRLYVPPWAPELGVQPALSPWFTDWNAGKRFVALDLTRPRAVELAKRLVAESDVVVENQTPGVMERLGLGWEELRRVCPDVVMLSTSGYGDGGPCRRYVTWGPNIEALSALATLSGFPWRDCAMTQYAHPDPLSALHGLFAVLCALAHRRRTGRGQRIDLSQFEATVSAIGHALMEVLANDREPQRIGNRSRRAAPHGCYPCVGNDAWCAIAVESQRQWERFCAALGNPPWTRDPRFATLSSRLAHVDDLDRHVGEWTAARGKYEVMAVLQAAGVAAGAVQDVEDLARRDPQLAARRFFEEVVHRQKGTVTANGIPLGLTGTPGRTGPAGAAVGEDNQLVFGELLGMTPGEMAACVAAGAIEVGE